MKGFHNKEKGIGILYDDIYLVNGMRTPFGKFAEQSDKFLQHASDIAAGFYCVKPFGTRIACVVMHRRL